jgi:hypothetical protein
MSLFQLSVINSHCSGLAEDCPEYPGHQTSSHQVPIL